MTVDNLIPLLNGHAELRCVIEKKIAEYKIIATDGHEYLIDIDISDKKYVKPQKCIKCEYINDLLRKINQNNDFIKIK